MLKDLFLLDPEIVFLNHGSFGATPRPVFEAYQAWGRLLERQPVEFLDRRAADLLAEARDKLAAFLNVEPDEVVYFPNPTTALNMVARNLSKTGGENSRSDQHLGTPLGEGDEILTTDHEYGALDRTWRYTCRLTGAHYVQRSIPLPADDPADLVEHFWGGVNERTRLVFISHITSPTALTFPVAEICQRARRAGILSIVDGAHAPGQISLDLKAVGADIYAGACHKWLCAPKGSAFLYVRREIQEWLDPLVVSWGYEAEPGFGCGIPFIDYHEWQGTRDLAAFLSVPSAIEFQARYNWDSVRRRCHALGVKTRTRIEALTGLEPLCPDEWFIQMFAARLPERIDHQRLKQRLYNEYRIEVPIMSWNNQKLIRVSFQAYNEEADAEALVKALGQLLSEGL